MSRLANTSRSVALLAHEQRLKAVPQRHRGRPGRSTAEDAELRALRVMNIARDIFIAHGFSGTPLWYIADRAGVAVRTLYIHFGDKTEIFRKVILASSSSQGTQLEFEENEDLTSALKKAAYYCFHRMFGNIGPDIVRLMIAESVRFPDLIAGIGQQAFLNIVESIATLFRKLAERGLIPDNDHELSARLFADLMLGKHCIMLHFERRSEVSFGTEVEAKIELFSNGRLNGGEIP